MKKTLLIAILLTYTVVLSAQVPSSFNYQSVIHNAEGELVSNQNINFRFYILEGSASGATVYSETQIVKSNNFGVCNLKIGTGADASGSLSDIDWGANTHFLKIAVDISGSTNFVEIGTTELLAVPYSLYSGDATRAEQAAFSLNSEESNHALNSDNSLYSDTANVARKLDEEVLYFTNNDTLFAVKDRGGNLVFAVFPDGARVYVNEGVKGNIGGFAVTGRNPDKAFSEEDYMVVTPDSTRVWVNEQVKGRIGGFAVTGRNPDKGMSGDYFVINSDSARIYINDTTTNKGRIGGFAVTGRNPEKGPNDDYLRVTRDSTRVYVNESTTKGRIGGFAVTGRNPEKGDITSDYFNVSGNSSAEIVNNEKRVMWYPQKSALLAGEVHVGDNDSVGTNSTALGYRSIAMGNQSQAFGYQAKAFGDYSTAIGKNALADTINSFAFGNGTQALSENSFAIGQLAVASGKGSFAFGFAGVDSIGNPIEANTQATGDYSYALGAGCAATQHGAIAIGTLNSAAGKYSLAGGYNSQANAYASVALGDHNIASGEQSTAFGSYNKATGFYSFAAGRSNTSSGNYSAVFGELCTVSGARSFATGIWNTVSGEFSGAFGRGNIVTGDYSYAFGDQLSVDGDRSFAICLTNWHYTVTASNTMAIMGGKVGINNASPVAILHVYENSSSTGTWRGRIAAGGQNVAVVLGEYNSQAWLGAYNKALTEWRDIRINPEGNDIYLGNVTSTVYVTGTFSNTSDRRLKENIEPLNYGLKETLKLKPVSFYWKEHKNTKQQLGFIAQDLQEILPELISETDDGYLSIDYIKLFPVLVNAIKQQQQIIETQEKKIVKIENNQKEIELLKQENEELEKRLAEIEKLLNK